jgi:uncharacterized integral membrane protein
MSRVDTAPKTAKRRHGALKRYRTLLRNHWPFVAILVVVVLPMLWMSTSLAVRLRLFGFTGTPDPMALTAFLTFIGGGLAAAATLLGALLTKGHNDRERRRLELESVIRSLESMRPGSKGRVAGVISATVLLGQPRVAIRVLEPLWQDGEVDPATATWILDEVLIADDEHLSQLGGEHLVDDLQIEAATLLLKHAERGELTNPADVKGSYYFPGHFMHRWHTELPDLAKQDLLLAMGEVLVSRDRDWWSSPGTIPRWPTLVWMQCAETDPNPVIRASAAALLDALCGCYAEQLESHPESTVCARLRGIRDKTHGDADRVPFQCCDLGARISQQFGTCASQPHAAVTGSPVNGGAGTPPGRPDGCRDVAPGVDVGEIRVRIDSAGAEVDQDSALPQHRAFVTTVEG